MNRADPTGLTSTVSRLRLLQWVNLFATPLLVLGFAVVEATTDPSPPALMALIAVAVLGSIVLGLFFLVATWLVGRFPWGESWGSILVVLIVGGIARAFTLEGGLGFLGINDEVSFSTRLTNSVILIPVTMGLALRGLEFLQQYRQRRNQLVGLLLQGEQQLRRQVLPSSGLENTLLSAVEKDLSAVNQSVAKALLDTKRLLREDSGRTDGLWRVRDQADYQWRALSHQLWEQSAGSMPRVSAREFVNTVALLRPFSLGYLALGAFFLFSLSLVRILPPVEAVVWSVGWYAVMALASLVLNEIPRHAKRPGLALSFLLAPYVLGGAVFIFAPGVPEGAGWGAAGIHFTIAVSMLLIGAGPAVSQSQDTILAALRRLLDNQSLERIRVESEASILAQKFAERLHSDIRGSFHAKMMLLQKRIDAGEWSQAEDEIDAMVKALRDEQVRQPAQTTIDDLLAFLHHWDGIITITHTINRDAVSPQLVEPLTTIVINAVNDAVRHGGAENIGVSIQQDTEGIVLEVTDDGHEASPEGPGGLGNASLDRLAPSSWTRTRTSGVTKLSVRFPDHSP
mgnify:CR=1 FL=1